MISIVTGTLNRRHLLPDLLENTVGDSELVELILVDGGSTDGTIEYANSLKHDRVKFIEIGHRSKYAHFMGVGIESASYEYVCQWNDDVLLLGPWGRVIDVLKEPYDVFIFSWRQLGCSEPVDKDALVSRVDGWVLYNSDQECCLNFGVYKKDVFKKIGMYDSVFDYYYADKDMADRSRAFGYRIRSCPEIKVLGLYELPKQARLVSEQLDYDNGRRNMALYANNELPSTVKLLK